MTLTLKEKLVNIAKNKQTKDDPSHDFQHILRVTNLAQRIAEFEKADLEIVVPAALFHDSVVYKKNSLESKNETEESALYALEQLNNIDEYPKEKIERVQTCIRQCSFLKGITPNLIESKILQDADRLEATGAVSIMRTFASCGQMNIQFYDPDDPFCKKGTIPFKSGIDLFYNRLLLVEDRMHTAIAKKIAKRRSEFLGQFLKELEFELQESEIIKTL